MDFPEQSIKQAREIVEKYRRRFSSKLGIAKQLYNNDFLEIHYGFNEAIKAGNCGRYLHEIIKEAECFTFAGVLYLITREAGLNPQLYMASGVRDIKEGEDLSDVGGANHTFITVNLRKNKTHMLDPQMGLFGEATFHNDRHRIDIYEKEEGEISYRHYASLKKLSEEDYLKELEESRGSKIGRKVLTSTQKVKNTNKRSVFITYLPKTDELLSSLHFSAENLFPEPYNKEIIFDLITSVANNGEFDFSDGRLEMYYASATGWDEHENAQVPLVFPARDAQNIWTIWDYTMKKAGRKSPVKLMNQFRLKNALLEKGFGDDFTVKEGSEAEQLIKNLSLEESLRGVQEAQRKSIDTFLINCRNDEISYKSILRDAHYTKTSDKKRSEKNLWGMVFSDEEHLELLQKLFRGIKKQTVRVYKGVIERAKIRARLQKGSEYHADRVYNRLFSRERKESRYFDVAVSLRRSRFPLTFHAVADEQLFKQQFDLEKQTIQELEEGIEKEHLRRATQKRLFRWLLDVDVNREALFLAQYKKGLQKILNQES